MSHEPKIIIPKKQIEDIIEDKLKSAGYLSRQEFIERLEEVKPSSQNYTYRVEELLPNIQRVFKCPDVNCSKIHNNPNFKASEYYCRGCGTAFGNEEQTEALEACPTCGSKKPAIHVEQEED